MGNNQTKLGGGEKPDLIDLVDQAIRDIDLTKILQSVNNRSTKEDPTYKALLGKVWFLENSRYFRGLLLNALETRLDEFSEDCNLQILSRHFCMALKNRNVYKEGKELGEIEDVTLTKKDGGDEMTILMTLIYYKEVEKKEPQRMKRRISASYDELMADYEVKD